MQSFNGKRVTVMGLGLHGGALGTVQWLLGQGARVTITDTKTAEELAPTIEKLQPIVHPGGVQWVLGEHRDEDFTDTDLVVRNPGVPKGSPYVQKAREAGVPIEMDSSLFFLNCPSKEIIGVTGSKGKTTAAKGITSVLKAGGKKVIEVGTDGISPLGKLNEVGEDTIVVFELSSWRLEALATHGLSPHIAVITSIYREHLNTYESFAEYVAAKKTIIRYQRPNDIAILNRDDTELASWEQETKGEIVWYSQTDAPKNTQLIGIHQQQNLVPAMKIAALYGISENVIGKTLASLPPLPHRLETVAEKNGVTYINDSAATMPDATIAALDALRGESLVLILGGSDKDLEFEKLAQKIIESNIRALIWLPGTATERMKASIHDFSGKVGSAASMQEAVQLAQAHAQPGGTILFSPGATSFGLFKHEFDRGDKFKIAVRNLASTALKA